MLIPFGVFGAAGAGGGAAAGAYELISTATGTGSSGTITLSSIPATYKHLQVRINARSTWAGVLDNLYMQLNNDTTANYSYHRLRGTNATVTSAGGSGQSYILSAKYTGSSAPTGATGVTIMDILDYASTTKNKTIRLLSGGYAGTAGTQSEVVLASTSWNSTAAINRLDVIDLNGSFTTSTRVSLYGIKG